MIASVSIVLNDKQIKSAGDCSELEKVCVNVQELDLSKNDFSDWSEVNNLIKQLILFYFVFQLIL